MVRRTAGIVWIALLLTACGGAATVEPTADIVPITPEVTAPQPTATTPPERTPEPTGTPAPAQPVVGEAVHLGRGALLDAGLSTGGEQLALGWSNGVSVVAIHGLRELWYQPLPNHVVAIGHGAQHVAAVLSDGDVWLFDAETGDGQVFEGAAQPQAYWGDLAWSPAGDVAALQTIGPIGGDPVLLLNPETGTINPLPDTRIWPNWAPVLVWSPDGTHIASSDGAGQGWVLDATTGDAVLRLEGGEGFRGRVHAWVDEHTVIADTPDNTLAFVDIATGEQSATYGALTLSGLTPLVDSGVLLTAEAFDFYEIPTRTAWDLQTGARLATDIGEQRHVNSAGCLTLKRPMIAVVGEAVLTLDTDGRLMRWPLDGAAGEVLGELPLRPVCFGQEPAWSPDGERVATSNVPSGVLVWETATGRLLFEDPAARFPAALSADLLAYTTAAGELVLRGGEGVRHTLPGPVTGHPAGAAFSPDGGRIAYGVGNVVHIADATSGEALTRLEGYPEGQQISHLVWAPDGSALVAASGQQDDLEQPGEVILWELDPVQEVFGVQNSQSYYTTVSPLALFSPAGRYAALWALPEPVAGMAAVQVFDRQAGEVVLRERDHNLQQWLAEGVLLGSEAQYDTRFVTWDLASGEAAFGRAGAHQMALVGVYAPDGVHHVGILHNPPPPRALEITRWRTGQRTMVLHVGSDVNEVYLSPGGRWIAANAAEGVFRVWPVTWPDPAREGR